MTLDEIKEAIEAGKWVMGITTGTVGSVYYYTKNPFPTSDMVYKGRTSRYDLDEVEYDDLELDYETFSIVDEAEVKSAWSK